MKISLHRLFTVILMLAFGISGMIYFIMDSAQLHYKVTASNHLSQKTSLDIIKMPLQDLKAQAGNNELWHEGKLYDVSSYSVVGDTAIVSVFHDGDEERLVKNIAASFETGNEYCSNNGQHISKHKVHVPDGKILPVQHALASIMIANERYLLPYFLYYASVAHTAVIKPPPRIG